MKNCDLIMRGAQELAEAGKILFTGRMVEFTTGEGRIITIPETEEIHTYNGWRDLGYQVRKGEKSIGKIKIWKYTRRKEKVEMHSGEEKEINNNHMYMTNAAFFTEKQVDEIKTESETA